MDGWMDGGRRQLLRAALTNHRRRSYLMIEEIGVKAGVVVSELLEQGRLRIKGVNKEQH